MSVIRKVTSAYAPDAPFIVALVRVFRDAREAHLRFTLDLHSADEDRHFLSERVLPNHDVWLAEIDHVPAGFIACSEGWIRHLYIDPPHQRQGLGARLLACAQRDRLQLELWTFACNSPAIAFYRRHGFHIAEQTDGADNEAKMPDLRLKWINEPSAAASPV